ncbi:Response regulator receiver protein [Beggiatoa sp. PS]|nr:Response regulator receiver protein [Beggiatoa sp. PS]
MLVIDDDPVVRDLFKTYLIKQGYKVIIAQSGYEGLRLARKLHPDAITLDVMMPGMDGWMVLSALKTDPVVSNIPVIMASMIEDKQLGYSLGAADYLVKPIEREQLTAILEKHHINHQTHHHVMVLEDDPSSRQLMEAMLTKAGWSVSTAENGRIGLEKIAKNIPDLILLDLMMPEMDGFEFTMRLRENEKWRAIPIIVLTAKDITHEDRLALNNYVQTVFQKGHYQKDKLLLEIKELLGNNSLPTMK